MTLLAILLASLAGSVHCAAMCGPFVCVYAGVRPGTIRGSAHVAYHGGRLLSYTFLGAVAGSLGLAADRLGPWVGVSRGAALLAGTLMVSWGLTTILRSRGLRVPWSLARSYRTPLGVLLGRLRDRPAPLRAVATGLLTTLLPCGWLYVFVAAAAGSGSALGGLLTMGVFWLGTLPALTTLSLLAQRLAGRYGRRLPVASACLVVVIGLLTIAGRLGLLPVNTLLAGPVSAGHH